MGIEAVPDTWDSDRDERFFRITARLLPCAVVEATSSLLASYDEPPTVLARGVVAVRPRVPVQAAGRG